MQLSLNKTLTVKSVSSVLSYDIVVIRQIITGNKENKGKSMYEYMQLKKLVWIASILYTFSIRHSYFSRIQSFRPNKFQARTSLKVKKDETKNQAFV